MAGIQKLIAWVMALRATRSFLHYSSVRGPILAAGLAYQAIFAVFAAVWVGFSVAGLIIGRDVGLRESLISTVSAAVPGLIDTGSGSGAIDPSDLLEPANFSWTGIIALAGLLLTALGFLASARDAVRVIFGLEAEKANVLLLKVRDLGLAVAFGVAIAASAVLTVVGTGATSALLDLVGVSSDSPVALVIGRLVALLVMLALDTAVLAALYRLLAGVHIPGRQLRIGALIGGIGLGVLKVLLGLGLIGGASANPLLASFAVIIGLLVFFNFACQVILIGAAWVTVSLQDEQIPIEGARASRVSPSGRSDAAL